MPDYRSRVNLSLTPREAGTRYLAEVTSFRDENTGATKKPVQVARKNLRILAEGESLQGNSALRIANIEKPDAGTFRLNPRFVPPLLNISASDYALGILRGLIEISPHGVRSFRECVARKTRAWRISRLPTSRISGCCTP